MNTFEDNGYAWLMERATDAMREAGYTRYKPTLGLYVQWCASLMRGYALNHSEKLQGWADE